MQSVRVLRCRLKDKHAALLSQQAREVNLVWNYCNELSIKVWERERRFISAYEIASYTKGAVKEGLSLHSQTVQAIAEEFVLRRCQFKRVRLSWRKSSGTRRSLGWIPFKASAIAYKNGQIRYCKQFLSLWDSYGLADHALGTGSICEDSRGRWYINITVKVKAPAAPVYSAPEILDGTLPSTGIDLGLKDLLTTSAGDKVEAQRFYRDLEPALAIAQRANKKCRTRSIHAKTANRRKDHLHKLSRDLVSANVAIFVGNVNASGLAKAGMAKSILDAGWSTFRTMLQYKCADAGAWFEEVNEAHSTVTCSVCHAHSGPKGLKGLRIREWACTECGTHHDRDVNAAKIILARGHARLAVGIPNFTRGRCQESSALTGIS